MESMTSNDTLITKDNTMNKPLTSNDTHSINFAGTEMNGSYDMIRSIADSLQADVTYDIWSHTSGLQLVEHRNAAGEIEVE